VIADIHRGWPEERESRKERKYGKRCEKKPEFDAATVGEFASWDSPSTEKSRKGLRWRGKEKKKNEDERSEYPEDEGGADSGKSLTKDGLIL